MLQLILSVFFDEAPDFKMIVVHVGGIIPYLKGRLEAYSAPSPLITATPKLLHPPGHYLTNLYVDTVCYQLEVLDCCYKMMGAGHLLYGTDHPFGNYRKATEIIEQLDCSVPERELIYYRNIEQLFRLNW